MSATRRNDRPPAPRHYRGAWLSLFAMLMIFIGPLVSQSMPMDQHAGMSMSMPATMDMSADSHAHHSSEHAMPADTGMSDHALWAKCGYCTLLFSCPALPQVVELVAAPRQGPVTSSRWRHCTAMHANRFSPTPEAGRRQRSSRHNRKKDFTIARGPGLRAICAV
ncbi:Uncharacterized protein ALO94_02751 [Pseudomonas syringae pv. spinaceae]|uniref:Multicopper oxidase n=1 Tax=Pseudomonas syringae pv. spinaceae TaxID=264459 RepID=A0A0Q0ASK2_PSESX|nr:DUF2946 domain-containing protein [Pseudomonas syringae]KPY66692.1 Uncharacterized protein ALO94_02751 [Pseudomonas syringae pv. spinaceae]